MAGIGTPGTPGGSQGQPPDGPPPAPRWFSPFQAQYMTDRDWIAYFGHVSDYLLTHSNAFEAMCWQLWARKVIEGRAGGPQDGG